MTQQAETAPTETAGADSTESAEPSLAEVMERIEKIEADSAGRIQKLVGDLARLRRKTSGSDDPKPETGKPASTFDESAVAALVEYRVAVASLPEEARAEAEEMFEEAGPKAALRFARALTRSKPDEETPKDKKPARAGTAAQPSSAREYTPVELLRLPPAERAQVLARIRRGEDSFTR